jgi:hypothetical protein
MDWKSKLQAARDSGQQLFDRQSQLVIEEHWPQVQALFREKVGPAALAAAQDDSKMELLFKVVYSVLPGPVKLLVNEGSFVQFCFSHRNDLLPPSTTGGSQASG